jgi:hypothetical protein
MSDLQRQVSEGRSFFFLHIPKTAGTSVGKFLMQRFPAGSGYLMSNGEADAAGRPSWLDRSRLVIGHANSSFLRQFHRRPVVLTFLRDPVDRALSHYYYYRQLGSDFLGRLAGHSCFVRATEVDVARFVHEQPDDARSILGNLQVAFLAPRERIWAAGEGPGSDALALALAEETLAGCECLGLYERLGESREWLCRAMGWPAGIPLPRENRTRGRPIRQALDAPTRRLLEKLTALDREVYEHGRVLFARRLADAAITRFLPGDRPAPAVTRLTFDQPIPGGGWLDRERSQRGWVAWLEREAWLELRVEPAPGLRLRFLADPVHLRQCRHLRVEADGQPLPLRFRFTRRGTLFEAAVPEALVRRTAGVLKVAFVMPHPLRPCDVVPGCGDFRLLGVSLSKVELRPWPKVSPWRSLCREIEQSCQHHAQALAKRVRCAAWSVVLAVRAMLSACAGGRPWLEPAPLEAAPWAQGQRTRAPLGTGTPVARMIPEAACGHIRRALLSGGAPIERSKK